MKRALLLIAATLTILPGCGEQKATEDKTIEDTTPAEAVAKEKKDMTPQARAFLDVYLEKFASLEKTYNLSFWTAATSGKKEDFDASAKAASTFSSGKMRNLNLATGARGSKNRWPSLSSENRN